MSHGHDISIPDGTQWREPVAYAAKDQQVRITIGEDSVATVELTARGEVEIIATVLQNASLTVVCVQTEESTIQQKAHLSTNASMHWQNVSLAPVEHSLESRIEGNHAVSTIDWIFYAKGTEKQTLSARNTFDGNEGGGEITMKGVAEGSAHVQCNGLIAIGPKGSGTDTYLTEDVLMLDRTAKIDAIPGLEIKTNDVKASHSATVSKVTPEDLFYFASRGIDEQSARQMYILGFLGDLTERIASETLREKVNASIQKKYAA